MPVYRAVWLVLVTLPSQARAISAGFEPNRGQAPAEALFIGHAMECAVVLGRSGATLRSGDGSEIGLTLGGVRSGAAPVGESPLPGIVNYLRGERSQWVTGVPQFGGVRYRDVYPGIDLVFHVTDGSVEYDFEAAPGADVRRIRLRVSGARRMQINAEGDLELEGNGTRIVHRSPAVYQEIDGRRRKVAAKLVLHGDELRFSLAGYDRKRPLVIDPLVRYGTYLGGSSRDIATALTVDGAGSAYVTGATVSADFPVTANALQTKHAGVPNTGIVFGGSDAFDAFVAKFTPDGSQLVYATFLGGQGNDRPTAIAVDRAGNATVTGITSSANFPVTTGALMPTLPAGRQAGFLTRLNATGSDLIFSTYIAGANGDTSANALALDTSGNVWVAGATSSPSLPVTGAAYQPKIAGAQDGYVLELNPQASAIVYGSYLGGKGDDQVAAIGVDAAGSCYLAGSTTSSDFPVTPGAFQGKAGGSSDAFVTQLSANGRNLTFSTFAGGSGDEGAAAIALGGDNSVYAAGVTFSPDFPTTSGAFQEKATAAGASNFVMRFDAGGGVHYSTLAGSGSAAGVGVMSDGTAVVAGQTAALDFPLTDDAYQRALRGVNCTTFVSPFPTPNNAPCADAFLTLVHESGRRLVYSTLLGGNGIDSAAALAMGADGSIYIAGATGSDDFVTTRGAFRTARTGGTCVQQTSPTASMSFACEDAFVLKMDPNAAGPVRPVAAVANAANGVGGPVAAGELVSLFGLGIGPSTADTARLGSDGRLLTTLSGTTVTFDGVPAPLLYAGRNQINCVVPFVLPNRDHATVRIDTQDYGAAVGVVSIAPTAPGLFSLSGTGQGQAAALNEDGSINGPTNPAARGSVLVLYGTGAGQTIPAGVDGRPAGQLATPAADIAVSIGGVDAKVIYAGDAPGLVEGVIQVNVVVPDGVAPGSQVPVVLTAGGAKSQANLYGAVR
jgi:uncharacterized protein (TIGR03437 family)